MTYYLSISRDKSIIFCMKMMQDVYLGLGGNVGSVDRSFQRAVNCLSAIPGIGKIQLSKIYRTTPVSDIPSPRTSMPPAALKHLWRRGNCWPTCNPFN